MENNLSIVKDQFKELPNNIEAEQLKVSSENHLKLQQQVFDKLMLEKQLKNSIKWYVEQIAIDFKQKRYEECIANVKKTFKLIISSEYIQAMKERIKLLSLTEKIVNIFSFLAIIYIIYFMLIDVFFNN